MIARSPILGASSFLLMITAVSTISRVRRAVVSSVALTQGMPCRVVGQTSTLETLPSTSESRLTPAALRCLLRPNHRAIANVVPSAQTKANERDLYLGRPVAFLHAGQALLDNAP